MVIFVHKRVSVKNGNRNDRIHDGNDPIRPKTVTTQSGTKTTETGNDRLISCIKLPKILIYTVNYAIISGFGRFRSGFARFGFRS